VKLDAVSDYLNALQERIVAALEQLDGGSFRRDAWTRPEGGGGISRLIEEGALFERGGVNFSRVQGANLPPSATAARPQLAGRGAIDERLQVGAAPRGQHADVHGARMASSIAVSVHDDAAARRRQQARRTAAAGHARHAGAAGRPRPAAAGRPRVCAAASTGGDGHQHYISQGHTSREAS